MYKIHYLEVPGLCAVVHRDKESRKRIYPKKNHNFRGKCGPSSSRFAMTGIFNFVLGKKKTVYNTQARPVVIEMNNGENFKSIIFRFFK